MNPIIHTCEQGSDEWFDAKRGKVGASRFKDVLNKKTGRGLYMRRLAGEIITGENAPAFSNDFMDEGVEKEAAARRTYETVKNCTVEQIGFYQISDYVGVSPDGLIGDDGDLEIKSPVASTHIKYILNNKLPSEYRAQVQGRLWAENRQWCDFVSYMPEMKSKPFHCIRIFRDEEYIKNLEKEIKKFVGELKGIIEKIAVPF